jgi:hypothetical protein
MDRSSTGPGTGCGGAAWIVGGDDSLADSSCCDGILFTIAIHTTPRPMNVTAPAKIRLKIGC